MLNLQAMAASFLKKFFIFSAARGFKPNFCRHSLIIERAQQVDVSGIPPSGLQSHQIGGATAVERGGHRVLDEDRLTKCRDWRSSHSFGAVTGLRLLCWDECDFSTRRNARTVCLGFKTDFVTPFAQWQHQLRRR